MYYDNAATTPLLPEVKAEIMKYIDYYGNPSSQHEEGFIIRKKIEEVRDIVAEIFCGNPRRVIFTSSGSASNNLVIKGLNDRYIFYYTPTAHKSMLLSCQSKKYHKEIKVDNNGLIDLEWLNTELKTNWSKKPVICYEVANSELGIYQNAEEIAKIVHENKGLIVADLTAYVPHLPIINPCDIADFYTFSAHKIGALKGVGIVYLNCFERLSPLIYGSQERGLFGGTENVIGIISLGAAIKALNIKDRKRFDKMAHYFQDLVTAKIEDCYFISEKCPYKIPQIMTVCFKGVSGEELVMRLSEEGCYISTGSACNSGSLEPSRALMAINLCEEDIPCCVRISFSGEETSADIKKLVDILVEKVRELRLLS